MSDTRLSEHMVARQVCPSPAPFFPETHQEVPPPPDRRSEGAQLAGCPGPYSRSDVSTHWMSATELSEFVACPERHRIRYREGFHETRLQLYERGRLSPSARGKALHDYLARVQPEWNVEQRHTTMTRAISRHARYELVTPEDHADELIAVANRFLSTEWWSRASSAERQHREMPFVFRLDRDTTLTGSLDLAYEEAGRWTIVDYKASALPGGVERSVALRQFARRYEVQAAVYALALDALGTAGKVTRVVLYSLESCAAVEIAVTPWLLTQWRSALSVLAMRARLGHYGNGPRWSADQCPGCPYLRLCRPPGAPDAANDVSTQVAETALPRGRTTDVGMQPAP